MNIFVIDLTTDKHFISIKYDGVVTDFIFDESDRYKRNDWSKKINDIQTSLPDFSFFKVDLFAYAAGPGSYTGARLAYTFLSTLKLITEKDFLAYSNLTALAWGKSDKVPVIKGNKNDFYYLKNNKEIYAANINTFDEKLSFVSTEPISEIENLEILPENIIAKNIVDMVSEGANHLTSNQPNYIKELQYRKLNG